MFNINITSKTIKRLIAFVEDRGWDKHHTTPELARALASEAAELSALHLWGVAPKAAKEKKEVGDIAVYLFYYCKKRGISLDDVINFAVDINEINYPLSAGDRPDRDK